jgi:hypothetical protein
MKNGERQKKTGPSKYGKLFHVGCECHHGGLSRGKRQGLMNWKLL